MMSDNWPTKYKDMRIAQTIMDEYAQHKQVEALGLFEVVVDERAKSMDFRLAGWVVALASRFHDMYGAQQGDYIIRQVIALCMRQNQILH